VILITAPSGNSGYLSRRRLELNIKRITISGVFLALASVALIGLGRYLPYAGLRHMLVYEASILALSAAALAAVRLILRAPLRFFAIGAPSAPSEGIKAFLVKPGASWRSTGLALLAVMALGTGAFMVMGMKRMGRQFDPMALLGNMHWIVLLAAVNAWSEELIYRVVPASVMDSGGALKAYPLLSAVIFGAAHFWGSPGGPVGVLMSGFLGWLLAISVRETKGIFWALVIHLALDLSIFGVLFGYGMIG
jgi:hypothetical protein